MLSEIRGGEELSDRVSRTGQKIGLESGQVRSTHREGGAESWCRVLRGASRQVGKSTPKKAVGLARVSESSGESSSPCCPCYPKIPAPMVLPSFTTDPWIHAQRQRVWTQQRPTVGYDLQCCEIFGGPSLSLVGKLPADCRSSGTLRASTGTCLSQRAQPELDPLHSSIPSALRVPDGPGGHDSHHSGQHQPSRGLAPF